MIYKLYSTIDSPSPNAATTVDSIPGWSFLFVPNQPYYEQFKQEINDGTAELQDVDGNTMSPDAAKTFVATLP